MSESGANLIRRLAAAGRRVSRQASGRISAGGRALPGFLVLGTQRGGTSTFYDYLARHPSVAPASRKEVHFFDRNHHRGDAWYRAHFPKQDQLDADDAITGEATPNYLFFEPAPARVARLLPEARFIVLLRDPVERAHSAWRLMVESGYEPLSFRDAVAAEPERIGGLIDAAPSDNPPPIDLFRYSYIARGRYAAQLERWFSFFDKDRFLILESRDLFDAPQETIQATTDFLGLPRHSMVTVQKRNHIPGEPLGLEERERVGALFVEDDRRLTELLGRPLSWSFSRGSQ